MNAKNKSGATPAAAALPKATKTVTNIDVPHLQNVVQLAAFAAEAQRVLQDIQHATKVSQDFDKGLRTYVEAPLNWSIFDTSLSSVLAEVALQLEQLADDVRRAEDGNEF